jgi:dihydroneopterin aldolase
VEVEVGGQDREWLERAAREIAALLKHDYERLMTVLYAIEPTAADEQRISG